MDWYRQGEPRANCAETGDDDHRASHLELRIFVYNEKQVFKKRVILVRFF